MTNYAFLCPRCQSTRIKVAAVAWLEILQHPTGEWEADNAYEFEFDENSNATCLSCAYFAPMRSFHASE